MKNSRLDSIRNGVTALEMNSKVISLKIIRVKQNHESSKSAQTITEICEIIAMKFNKA